MPSYTDLNSPVYVNEVCWSRKRFSEKRQRKCVSTERVPENILTPLLSLSFDFSPCYNGSACRVWKNIRVTRAEGISDGDEGWIRDELQYISHGSFGSSLEEGREKNPEVVKESKRDNQNK